MAQGAKKGGQKCPKIAKATLFGPFLGHFLIGICSVGGSLLHEVRPYEARDFFQKFFFRKSRFFHLFLAYTLFFVFFAKNR